jgi:hypothetical protein
MPRENVEFEFPDPDKNEASQEVEVDLVEVLCFGSYE